MRDEASGEWKKCSCLDEFTAKEIFRKAGIPEFYWLIRPEHLKAYSPSSKQSKDAIVRVYRQVLERGLQDQLTVIAGPMGQAKVVGYLLLKAVLRHHHAAVSSLEILTEWFLSQEKESFRWARDLDVLQVQFGEEYAPQGNKLAIHKHLLNHLVEYRGEPRFKTILVTNRTPMNIEEYGPQLVRTKKLTWLVVDPELQLEL